MERIGDCEYCADEDVQVEWSEEREQMECRACWLYWWTTPEED